jgi:hypothetical protein
MRIGPDKNERRERKQYNPKSQQHTKHPIFFNRDDLILNLKKKSNLCISEIADFRY